MKGKANLVMIVLVITMIFVSGMVIAAENVLEGDWLGELNGVRLIFHLTMDEDGTYTATMDSPDQGATGIAVSGVKLEGNQVILEINLINGSFTGQLTADGQEIDGTWSQNSFSLPFVLKKMEEGEETVNNRPQEPQPPYPYNEIEVSYMNEVEGIKLAGTLTTPKDNGPFPSVILITGSGSQDRDETLLGHKPFKVIADYLTRQGIAVLRFDDRGVGGSEGNPLTATSADLANDVLAGVKFLKNRSDIMADQIGLIGHSEGGIIAPMVATKAENVAFIVMLAGPGLPGDEIVMTQLEDILRISETKEEKIESSLKLQRELLDIVINIEDDNEAGGKMRAVLEEAVTEMDESDKEEVLNLYGSLEKYYKQTTQQLLLPWYRYFLTYDPRPTLSKVQEPVLAINGSKDVQVAAEENLSAIESALKGGGNEEFVIKEFPGLNHLFQHSDTGDPNEYGQIKETIAPGVLEFMADWILGVIK